jgi:ammonium transporter, Amt family
MVFWGGSSGIVLRQVLFRPVGNKEGGHIPELLYVLYQGMFACFT